MNIKQYFAKTAFADSFKGNGQKYLYSIVFDLVFLLAAFLVNKIFSFLSSFFDASRINDLRMKISDAVLQSSAADATKYTKELYSFLIFVIVYFLLFMLVMLLNWSAFRAFIYSTVYGTKLNLKKIVKFFVSNAVIFFGAFLLLLFSLYALQPQVAKIFITLLLIFIVYISIMFYNAFFMKDGVKESIKYAFHLGFKRIRTMFPAFVLVVVLGILFVSIISSLGSLIGDRSGAIMLLSIVAFLGWSRLYIHSVIKQKILKPSRAK